MSDFQKQTLKNYGRLFLMSCGAVLLIYGTIKSELVRYATLAVLVLIIVGGFVWGMIRVARWDWWLRGKLTEQEYKAYMACDTIFGYRDDKYIPTEAQIKAIVYGTKEDPDLLWSMYRKLNEGVQS